MPTRTRTSNPIREIERSVAAAAADGAGPLVLAVSGGLDSMTLLDAAARVAHDRIAMVATFDHGSGEHSTRAADFVCREAQRRGLRAVRGHGEGLAAAESVWREARWTFLRRQAAGVAGVVATAHTEDDQIETVLMRVMRGAGARGIAGLYAASDVCRPLLAVSRATAARYARERAVRWVSDPTNDDRRFFRNRVRHDLLPALLRARPGLGSDLLSLARRAATLRAEIEAVAASMVAPASDVSSDLGALSVAVADVAGYDAEALAVLWPAIAARVGLALDWRGTRRLVAFTICQGRVGSSIQLSGGWEVVRNRRHLTLRPTREAVPEAVGLPSAGKLRWGPWSFVRDGHSDRAGAWQAELPRGRPLVVRAWRPGDRMVGRNGAARRVKRFFGDAGITGTNRAGWPVVLAGEEIVWIPGVSHCTTSAGSTGRPGLIYSCELNHR